jgi:hypothetical protein
LFVPSPIHLGNWEIFLLALYIVLTLAGVYLEYRAEVKSNYNKKHFKKNDKVGIKDYMKTWIQEAGQAAIWTRDMSWVDDDATKEILLKKAKDGNLIVCMPRITELGKSLFEAGADVRVYGHMILNSPASRFTISHKGNAASRVAIGRSVGDTHIIEELDASDPAFCMASDLIAMAPKYQDKK